MGRATVLEQYQRLEAEGVWRPEPEAQRRDVIVSIGEATLTISDLNERVLTHWSLPAVERMNPGTRPALYRPGEDAEESLEIADAQMIDALAKVSRAIRRGQARPGRLRAGIVSVVSVLVLALVVFWLPGALTRYAASIIPDAARASIGQDVLAHVARVAGAPCADQSGRQSLAVLENRLFPDTTRRLVIVRSALTGAARIPGGILLAGHELVEDHETPLALSTALLSAELASVREDPIERLLDVAGISASLRLLTTGHLSEDDLAAYAADLIARTGPEPAPGALRAILSARSVSEDASPPILADGDWIALQQICES